MAPDTDGLQAGNLDTIAETGFNPVRENWPTHADDGRLKRKLGGKNIMTKFEARYTDGKTEVVRQVAYNDDLPDMMAVYEDAMRNAWKMRHEGEDLVSFTQYWV